MKDGKYVVLCVDDDPVFIDTTKIVLEMNGYVVETASSAQKGLAAYKETSPDFLLVDLMMEEVDAGIDLVKNLKDAGNTAPVFMISSVGEELNLNIDYNDAGLSGVFQKPICFETLRKTVTEKLDQSQ